MKENQEYITKQCIIEEFLNNWFTLEELSSYLCIEKEEVEKTINACLELNDKLANKVRNHAKLIENYYNNQVELDHSQYEELDYKILNIAQFIITNKASLRETAKEFSLGKTTVHEYIHEKLPIISIYIYKEVFDVLIENKSFSTNNIKVIEQVLKCYDYLQTGFTSKEIQAKLGISQNVLQRNLTTRLKKIDKEKYKLAQEKLREYQMTPLRENEFKSNGK